MPSGPEVMDALSPLVKEQGPLETCAVHTRGGDAQVSWQPQQLPPKTHPECPQPFLWRALGSAQGVHRPGVHLQHPGPSLTPTSPPM